MRQDFPCVIMMSQPIIVYFLSTLSVMLKIKSFQIGVIRRDGVKIECLFKMPALLFRKLSYFREVVNDGRKELSQLAKANTTGTIISIGAILKTALHAHCSLPPAPTQNPGIYAFREERGLLALWSPSLSPC